MSRGRCHLASVAGMTPMMLVFPRRFGRKRDAAPPPGNRSLWNCVEDNDSDGWRGGCLCGRYRRFRFIAAAIHWYRTRHTRAMIKLTRLRVEPLHVHSTG
jgi:hypothetical protein